jgi:hypothetical protein
MRWLILTIALLAPAIRAEIVDRIAATVGFEVITESRVSEQIRIAALINGTEPDLTPENRRKVLDSLIDQTLMRREVEFTRFPQASDDEVKLQLAQIQSRYPGKAFQEALDRYGVSESDLTAQLRWQLTMLRFIEYRFQPAVQVSDSQIRQEYRRQVAAWRERNSGEPPSMEQMRPELEKIMRQQLTDSALDRWLGEVRTQNTILYRGGYQ